MTVAYSEDIDIVKQEKKKEILFEKDIEIEPLKIKRDNIISILPFLK